MQLLKNKTILLTGASRGIGPHIALCLAREGATLALTARSLAGLSDTLEAVKGVGAQGYIFPCDLLQLNTIADLHEQFLMKLGRIDVLINNAGMEKYNRFERYSLAEMEKMITLNLLAPMELTRCVLPGMLSRKSGHIVNIASLGGKKAEPYNSAYAGSKGGIIMWSDGLRQELYGTGVAVSVICPGYISEAGMFHDSGGSVPALLGTSTPDDVAQAVLKALRKKKPELIVNKGPMRPLLAIGQISAGFGDRVVRWFGVPKLSARRIPAEGE